MARPTKPGEERRAVLVRVRVTLVEKRLLEEAARNAGMNVSDWLRAKTMETKPLLRKATPEKEVLLHLLAELNKQGSNINQIARQLNQKQHPGLIAVPLKMVYAAMESNRILTDQLREILLHGN